MLTKDFSQLPVMTSTRELKGVVSRKTIGRRLALNERPYSAVIGCGFAALSPLRPLREALHGLRPWLGQAKSKLPLD
ncbi:MAG: hypothetical protein ABSH34_00020 [Verrucomicrobiota bacterium]